jgi:Ca2+-binding EF-hand superfamily protein
LCFNKFTPEEIKKIEEIFEDIDFDRTGKISLQRACEFNAYMNKNVSKETNVLDAKEFINSCALVDKQTVVLAQKGFFGGVDVLICKAQILF